MDAAPLERRVDRDLRQVADVAAIEAALALHLLPAAHLCGCAAIVAVHGVFPLIVEARGPWAAGSLLRRAGSENPRVVDADAAEQIGRLRREHAANVCQPLLVVAGQTDE